MFQASSNSSGNSSSSYRRSVDHASGANAANKAGSDLDAALADYDSLLLKDPMAAVASANRIRRLQAYLTAFKTGGNLAYHEVIPRSRLSEESFSSDQSSSAANSQNFQPFARREK
jgi:hypothetical protein